MYTCYGWDEDVCMVNNELSVGRAVTLRPCCITSVGRSSVIARFASDGDTVGTKQPVYERDLILDVRQCPLRIMRMTSKPLIVVPAVFIV